MRYLLSLLVISCALVGSSVGQVCVPSGTQTCTPNIGLAIPNASSIGWNVPLNQNFALLDSLLSGTANLSAISFVNAGAFTNNQQNDYLQSIVNGCSPAALETGFGGANHFFEEAIVGCAAVPSTSTKVQVNGVAGLVTNAGTTTRTVGVFGLANALVANTMGVWGANFAVSSLAGFGGNPLYAAENDINVANTTDVAYGLLVAGNWSAQPTTSYGLLIAQPGPNSGAGGTNHWPNAILINTGATAAPDSNHCGLCLNPVGTGVNQQAQGLTFVANDPASGQNVVTMAELPNGNAYISNTKGGTGLLINNIQAAVTVGSGTSTSNGTAIGPGTSQAQPAITVTGATTSDVAHCSLNVTPPATWQTGIHFLPPVVTANAVTPWISNGTAGSITPVATAIRCTVTR